MPFEKPLKRFEAIEKLLCKKKFPKERIYFADKKEGFRDQEYNFIEFLNRDHIPHIVFPDVLRYEEDLYFRCLKMNGCKDLFTHNSWDHHHVYKIRSCRPFYVITNLESEVYSCMYEKVVLFPGNEAYF